MHRGVDTVEYRGVDMVEYRGVGGLTAHASIVGGVLIVPDDLAANHHRVDGKPVHPTPRHATAPTPTRHCDLELFRLPYLR